METGLFCNRCLHNSIRVYSEDTAIRYISLFIKNELLIQKYILDNFSQYHSVSQNSKSNSSNVAFSETTQIKPEKIDTLFGYLNSLKNIAKGVEEVKTVWDTIENIIRGLKVTSQDIDDAVIALNKAVVKIKRLRNKRCILLKYCTNCHDIKTQIIY